MKRVRFLGLMLVSCLCLSIVFNYVSAVDISYIGTYVDPTNEGTGLADIYLYFSVRKHTRVRNTDNNIDNDWEKTYEFLQDYIMEEHKYDEETNKTGVQGYQNEHKDLDGTSGSYNTYKVDFTGLVEFDDKENKEIKKNTYTSEYKDSADEAADYWLTYERDGNFKVAYDVNQGESKFVILPNEHGTEEEIEVPIDAIITTYCPKDILETKFESKISYVDISELSSQVPDGQTISYDLRQGRTTYYELYKTRTDNTYHENIELLKANGLNDIITRYADYYGIDKEAVKTSINKKGVRFSRSIATESFNINFNLGKSASFGKYQFKSMNANTKEVFQNGYKAGIYGMETGAQAILGLQAGSTFSSFNTGFNDTRGLGEGYGPGIPSKDDTMEKTKIVRGQSVLNNYDNILRIPLSQKQRSKVYVKYYRQELEEHSSEYKTELIRTPEFVGSTKVMKNEGTDENGNNRLVNVERQKSDYVSEYSQHEGDEAYADELLIHSFDEKYEVEVGTDNILTVLKNVKYKKPNGKEVDYELSLKDSTFVIRTSISYMSSQLENSNRTLENVNKIQNKNSNKFERIEEESDRFAKFNLNLLKDNILAVKLVYKEKIKEQESKVYVQYYKKVWNIAKQKYEDNLVREENFAMQDCTKITNMADKVKVSPQESDYAQDDVKSYGNFDELFIVKSGADNSMVLAKEKVLTIKDGGNQKSTKYTLSLEDCRITTQTTYMLVQLASSKLRFDKGYTDQNKNKIISVVDGSEFVLNVPKNTTVALKIVYMEPEVKSKNKLLVQYNIKKWNESTGTYASPVPARQLAGQGMTTVKNMENYSNVGADVGSFSGFHEKFEIEPLKYRIDFKKSTQIGDKKYQLVTAESRYMTGKSALSISNASSSAKTVTNPMSHEFGTDENMGIMLVYEEVPEDEETKDAEYITLGQFLANGKLQFINVTNTGDNDNNGIFNITKTEASNITSTDFTISSAEKNNSLIDKNGRALSFAELKSTYEFFSSTFNEGPNQQRPSEAPSEANLSYDFIPSGEYISPYATGVYSYIVRAMTWQVNERTFDIANHRITAKRSYMYIIRWANRGDLPGFTHSKVPDSWLEWDYTNSNGGSQFTFRDIHGNITVATSKIKFTKYWEVAEDVCPYYKSTYNALGDHYHSSSCCNKLKYDPNEGRNEFMLNTLEARLTHNCGIYLWTDYYQDYIQYTLHREYDEYGNVTSETIEQRYGSAHIGRESPYGSYNTGVKPHTTKMNSDGTGVEWGGIRTSDHYCSGAITYSPRSNPKGNKYQYTEKLVVGTHTTSQVRNGKCEWGKIDKLAVSVTGDCDVWKCPSCGTVTGHTLGGEKSGAGSCEGQHIYGSWSANDLNGLRCRWFEYYSTDKYLDGYFDSYYGQDQTELYTGHYHHIDCFNTSYDDGYAGDSGSSSGGGDSDSGNTGGSGGGSSSSGGSGGNTDYGDTYEQYDNYIDISSYSVDAASSGDSRIRKMKVTFRPDKSSNTSSYYQGYYHDRVNYTGKIELYQDKYLKMVKPNSSGILATARNSGIADGDTYVYGLEVEGSQAAYGMADEGSSAKINVEKEFKDAGIIISSGDTAISGAFKNINQGVKTSPRDYEGTYTLKYYTIENFMLYKIKDMIIYDENADRGDIGTDVFGKEQDIIVTTSGNYDNLFREKDVSGNGLVSDADKYNGDFLQVKWGASKNENTDNQLVLDITKYGNDEKTTVNSTYESKKQRATSKAAINTSYSFTNLSGASSAAKAYIQAAAGNAYSKEYTFAQIVKRANTYITKNGNTIYPYVGADGKGNGYADSMTSYRSFEDSYVFLSDTQGYTSGQIFDNIAEASVKNITDTEVALRIGLLYSISNFHNDYFKFIKNYGENIEYFSHHNKYSCGIPLSNTDSTNLLNANVNWLKKVEYNYTWEHGMLLKEPQQPDKTVKTKDKLMQDKSFLSKQAAGDLAEINSLSDKQKEENELKKLFDATNFTNEDAKKYANGNKILENNSPLKQKIRGIKGTYMTGEDVNNFNSSSYIYTRNYESYADNAKNTHVTDIYDWTLMNLPVSALYKNDGTGNGKRTFRFKIEYELVTADGLYKNSSEIDSYTNYTSKLGNAGKQERKNPDVTDYIWTEDDLKETDYTWIKRSGGVKSIEGVWVEPDDPDNTGHYYRDSQVNAIHIHDWNFTDEGKIDCKVVNTNDNDTKGNNSISHLNVLTPVSVHEGYRLVTSDLIEHVATNPEEIKNVLGKNTQFTVYWRDDTSTASAAYGRDASSVLTTKYTKEYWIRSDFDLYCSGCIDHRNGGYHEAGDVVRYDASATWYTPNHSEHRVVARTTGTYGDPAVGNDENNIKILAISKNIPDRLSDFVEDEVVANNDTFQDERKNIIKNTEVLNEKDNNTNLLNDYTISDAYHIAFRRFESDSIFRIFGFEITDFTDVQYKKVFKNGITPTKNYYAGRYEWEYEIYAQSHLIKDAGSNNMVDRNSKNSNKNYLVLPVGPKSNTDTGYSYAPKLGYTFAFNLKTTGYFSDTDPNKDENSTIANKGQSKSSNRRVEITPTYYYIKKDGTGFDENIQLYYKDENDQYIRFENSGYKIGYKPNDGYRTLRFTAIKGYSDTHLSSEVIYKDISKTFTISSATDMTTSYSGFIQTWYGQFKLPNSTIAVKNNNVNAPLKDGYIGVRFDIKCIDETSKQTAIYDMNATSILNNNDEIKQNNTNTSQWDFEGNFGFEGAGQSANISYELEEGTWNIDNATWQKVKSTVVIYDTDFTAEDDFE